MFDKLYQLDPAFPSNVSYQQTLLLLCLLLFYLRELIILAGRALIGTKWFVPLTQAMSVFKIKSNYISIKGTYCVFLMFFQICTATLADARA